MPSQLNAVQYNAASTNAAPTTIGNVVYDPKTQTHSIVTGNGLSPLSLTALQGPPGPCGPTGAMGMQGLPGIPGGTYLTGTTTISAGNRTVTMNDLLDFMDDVRKQLLILKPMMEMHEKYPALKSAYDDYLLIQKLVSGDHGEMP